MLNRVKFSLIYATGVALYMIFAGKHYADLYKTESDAMARTKYSELSDNAFLRYLAEIYGVMNYKEMSMPRFVMHVILMFSCILFGLGAIEFYIGGFSMTLSLALSMLLTPTVSTFNQKMTSGVIKTTLFSDLSHHFMYQLLGAGMIAITLKGNHPLMLGLLTAGGYAGLVFYNKYDDNAKKRMSYLQTQVAGTPYIYDGGAYLIGALWSGLLIGNSPLF